MTVVGADWVRHGEGRRPRPAWSFGAEAPLVALDLALETRELLAADAVGGLYLVDRQGQTAGVTRGPSPIRATGWSDTGAGGVALVGEEKLYWFDRQLTFQGWVEHQEPVLCMAFEAHGRYTAVALASGRVLLYDCHRKVERRFRTNQPIKSMVFAAHVPALVMISEYGMLLAHHFTGELLWQQQLFANVADLAMTGDGQSILLACYTHGIQCHNASGAQVGSYQVGGTVCRVATSYLKGKLAAATLERHFYYLDAEGQVIWQATLPDDVLRLLCDPLGTAVVCGFQGGRVMRLEWPQTEPARE